MTRVARPPRLACIECGASTRSTIVLECATLPRPARADLRFGRAAPRGARASSPGGGLWRYAPVLPIADPAHRVTLGEGQTPAARLPGLGRQLGVRRLQLKFEGSNPTGTVKDRSSATAVAAALQFGFRATSVVSSGNAGSSIAAYSARAGLRSLIFAYERTSAPKLLHMTATATDLVLYQGVYDDLITHLGPARRGPAFFDCGASRNAYKHEGKKTLAYEIAEQSAGAPPTWWWRPSRWARRSSPPPAAFADARAPAGSRGGPAWWPRRRRGPTPSCARGAPAPAARRR